MSWATPADLRSWATEYRVTVPDDPERLLELATGDVASYLGARWDLALLEPEQVQALTNATCVQALFRIEQGGQLMLGADDGIAAVGPVSFRSGATPRLSPEVPVLVAGLGLYARSGTVDPLDAATA